MRRILCSSLSASTLARYRKVWCSFDRFVVGLRGRAPQLPFGLVDVMYFVASLSGRGLAPATIAGQMSAIGFLHKLNGVPDPVGSGVVRKMLQGVRRMGVAGDLRLPVTADILVWLCVKLDGGLFGPYQASMMRALVTVAFFVFFRLGELVQKGGSVVVMLDGVVFPGEGMSVTLRRSKTSVVPVVIRVVRALDVRVCPVRFTGEFLRVRGRVPGPLFCAPAGGGYSYSRVCRMLRVLFQACGLDADRFKGHSFRIGAASEAARLGYSDAQIRLMGRWRSDAFRRYIRLSF